jgi:hypothetical protein
MWHNAAGKMPMRALCSETWENIATPYGLVSYFGHIAVGCAAQPRWLRCFGSSRGGLRLPAITAHVPTTIIAGVATTSSIPTRKVMATKAAGFVIGN